MHTIRIKQWKTPLQTRKGMILDAALSSGIPYPHSCRSGECGNCKTRLLKGEVKHEPYSKDALTDEEREQGLILACRARPKSDIEIAWDSDFDASACAPIRQLQAKVVELTRAAQDVTKVRLQVEGKALEFAAGQYARLTVGDLPARSYSMANRTDEDILEFHVRHVPDGLVSGYIANELKAGDSVGVEGPFGTAYLREDHIGPIVAVGGGTGLAPVMSIIRTALVNMPLRPMHVYFGVRSEADIYAAPELAELEKNPMVSVHIVLSSPNGPTKYRTGYAHHALEQDFEDLSAAKVYLCGPPPMVTAVTECVVARGVQAADVHSDPFTPSADKVAEPVIDKEADHPMTIQRSAEPDSEKSILSKLSSLFKFIPMAAQGPEPGPSVNAENAETGNAPAVNGADINAVQNAAQPEPEEAETATAMPTLALESILTLSKNKNSKRLLPPYLEHAESPEDLLPWLYLQGIRTENVRQLKGRWQREYVLWSRRDLSTKRYLYWWADGIYHSVDGSEQPHCTLLLAGVDEQGQAEFIAIESGDRESPDDWKAMMERLQRRGLRTAPKLAIADARMGFLQALSAVFPQTAQQYCWSYEKARLFKELPKKHHKAIQAELREVWAATDSEQAEQIFYQLLYSYWLHSPKSAERMEQTMDQVLQFQHFPKFHQRYLRSSEFLFTTFSSVCMPVMQEPRGVTSVILPALLYQLGRNAEKRWPKLMSNNTKVFERTLPNTLRAHRQGQEIEAA